MRDRVSPPSTAGWVDPALLPAAEARVLGRCTSARRGQAVDQAGMSSIAPVVKAASNRRRPLLRRGFGSLSLRRTPDEQMLSPDGSSCLACPSAALARWGCYRPSTPPPV
jgi:hypothetical protein